MKKISKYIIAIALLAGGAGVMSSCQEDGAVIKYSTTITVENDFTKVVDAINEGTIKMTEAVAQLKEAIDKMAASQAEKLQSIMGILDSQNTLLETKLAAIDAAMQAQTLSLENKMDILSKAVDNNTIAIGDMSTNLAKAIDSMDGTIAGKLADIEQAIADAGTEKAKWYAAISGAMEAHTIAFEEKMKLLTEAIETNTDRIEGVGELLAGVIDTMKGSLAEKLENIKKTLGESNKDVIDQLDLIKAALSSQTSLLEEKLKALVDLMNDLPDYSARLDAIKAAIEKLPDYSSRIEAIETAIKAIPDYSEKLGLIVTAINGLPDLTEQINAIATALGSIKAQIEGDESIQKGIKTEVANIASAINDLKEQVENGNKDEKEALDEIIKKLGELKGSIGGGTDPGTGGGTDPGAGGGTDPGTGGGTDPGSGSGSGSSGSFIPSTLKTLTQSNYFQWDAVDPVNGTNPDYNPTTTGNATNSCKDAPTFEEMKVYLGNGVYWDNGDAGTNQQSYTVDGTSYNKGLWVKKWENCDKSLSKETVNSAPLFNTGRPDASEIDKYFFLPACGKYEKAYLDITDVGGGNYWLSSRSTIYYRAYNLQFDESGAKTSDSSGLDVSRRFFCFVPMPKL